MAIKTESEPGEPWYYTALAAYANMFLLGAVVAAVVAAIIAAGLLFGVADARPEALWNALSLALSLPLPAALLRVIGDIGRQGRRRG